MRLIFLYILFIPTLLFSQLDTRNIIYKGRVDIYNKKYDDAIEKFNSVITVKPELVDPYFYRAIAKYELKDYLGAETDFKKVIEMNTFYVSAYHYLGIVYGSMSDYYSAMKNLDKAIMLSPNDASIYLSRGITKLQMQETDSAIADFDRALKLDKQIPEIYLNKGIALMIKKQFDDAIKQFNQAIKLNVFYADAFARRGIAYNEKGNHEQALKDLSHAIKINGENSIFYYWRAQIYYENYKFDKAIADYNKIISMNPNNSLVYFNRALIKSDIGLYNDAIKDYEKVIELNPENVIPYFNIATIRLNNKEYDKAIDILNGAIKVFPEFMQAYEARSFAKEKMGDEKGAYLDRLKAKKLSESYESMKLDTNDFKKLIEFDDDFYSKEPYNKDLSRFDDIGFKIVNKDSDTPKSLKKYFYDFLEDINTQLPENYKIILSPSDNSTINKEDLLKLKNHFDSIPVDVNMKVYFIRGIIEKELKNYNKSEENFKILLKKDKNDIIANICMIDLLKEKLKYQHKLSNCKISVEINGMQSNYNTENTDDFYQTMIDLYGNINKTNDIINYNIANIYAQLGQNYTAVFYYTKAINGNSDFSYAYFNRALCYLKIKENKNACKDLSKAGELGIKKSYTVIEKNCKTEE